MSNGTQSLVQAKRTVTDLINSERARTEIAKVLPKHLTPERMTRVALTATLRNPSLLNCTPESLMNALLVCSQAGLEPDGRLAHLIPYGNVVQVVFDYKGLVTLALRNGAQSVFADKVCEYDEFFAGVVDGNKVLTHKPNWAKPRGTAYCYYALCKRDGQIDWEVMTVEEVQDIRKRSRAANNGPWVTDFDEMAKKTVLRRMSKRWDLLPEIRDIINADDDTPPPFGAVPIARPIFEAKAELPAPEPEPERERKEPVPATKPPEPATPEAKPATEAAGMNPLKAVRAHAKMTHIKEGQILNQLAADGTTDGSYGTLEELALASGGKDILQALAEQWPDFVARITGGKENE